MIEVIWATPLYEFLRRCNASLLTKEVLDCGAGGSQPPLSLFYHYGYKTYGIEIAETPLAEAQRYCTENNMPLDIIRGDMRSIPFSSKKFSYIYSYNAIDFMTKPDIAISMREITRVLKNNGLDNYIPLFKKHNIDTDIAQYITIDMLKSELGIMSLGDRLRIKKILLAIHFFFKSKICKLSS